MSRYRIGEIAERSGFRASALRYYEDIGLVVPAGRTDAGYRCYDDHTLERLAFIARAKELGCSLEEIADLAAIWDGERCSPVQRRFHQLLSTKIDDARRRMADLAAFTGQLRQAATQLAGPAVDGPCGTDCACLQNDGGSAGGEQSEQSEQPDGADPADRRLGGAAGVDQVAGPEPANGSPLTCTLDPAAAAERLEDWQVLFDHTRRRTRTAAGGLRVELDDGVDLAELARLVRDEQRCCGSLFFAITVDHRGTAVEIDAPEGARYPLPPIGAPA